MDLNDKKCLQKSTDYTGNWILNYRPDYILNYIPGYRLNNRLQNRMY